ncbi:DUF4817 domain-containing protein, partial [Trichonephila clavipes]
SSRDEPPIFAERQSQSSTAPQPLSGDSSSCHWTSRCQAAYRWSRSPAANSLVTPVTFRSVSLKPFPPSFMPSAIPGRKEHGSASGTLYHGSNHHWFFRDNELWFQQDGATCHTARATIDLLKDTFGDRLISRFGPVNWPPRSCDLTPLDYFLWGYVKSLVYADKPQKLDHLEDNIRRVIADIRPQMLEKVIENWTSRLDYIRANRGSPMPEIIFKIFTNLVAKIRPLVTMRNSYSYHSVTSSLGTYPTHSIHVKGYSSEQVAKRRSTWPWGHCLLFDLAATPTLSLKILMDIGVPTRRQ